MPEVASLHCRELWMVLCATNASRIYNRRIVARQDSQDAPLETEYSWCSGLGRLALSRDLSRGLTQSLTSNRREDRRSLEHLCGLRNHQESLKEATDV